MNIENQPNLDIITERQKEIKKKLIEALEALIKATETEKKNDLS